jgi:hypothetical protein
MKLKILLLVAGASVIGSSIFVLVIHSRSHQMKFAPPESQLPTVMSNYSKTFKLNSSPPIWGQQGITNGNH